MLYLLDANVLIDANRDYYPIDRVPEFWEWIENAGENSLVKIALEVYEEVSDGNDELAQLASKNLLRRLSFFKRKSMSLWSLTQPTKDTLLISLMMR